MHDQGVVKNSKVATEKIFMSSFFHILTFLLFMQIIANLENNKHLELVKMLFEQLNISFFVQEDEQSEEEDLEDAYLLKLANEARNEPTISFDTLLNNLTQAGKIA
jgi:predicted nucleic acid-binding protein